MHITQSRIRSLIRIWNVKLMSLLITNHLKLGSIPPINNVINNKRKINNVINNLINNIDVLANTLATVLFSAAD